MKADMFLNLYRELEDVLEKRYADKKRRYSSLVFEFLNDDESINFREKLDLCREVRNLLSHTAYVDGESVVQPSTVLNEYLTEIIAYLKSPNLAIDKATKADRMVFSKLNQKALKVMENMVRLGYSHIPVIDSGEFIGVFSHGVVFRYILENPNAPITENTKIRDLIDLLHVNKISENYEFCSRKLTVIEARKKFDTIKSKDKRLKVIFITENGKISERILGIVSPWDVMADK